jgi:hypothetical protein
VNDHQQGHDEADGDNADGDVPGDTGDEPGDTGDQPGAGDEPDDGTSTEPQHESGRI